MENKEAQCHHRFGCVRHVVPNGQVDGQTPAATAICEVLEEVGLLMHLDSHLIDLPRSTTFTQFCVGRRVGGSPRSMG